MALGDPTQIVASTFVSTFRFEVFLNLFLKRQEELHLLLHNHNSEDPDGKA